jgi:hypothetical protein
MKCPLVNQLVLFLKVRPSDPQAQAPQDVHLCTNSQAFPLDPLGQNSGGILVLLGCYNKYHDWVS